jgi:hypothetical protein
MQVFGLDFDQTALFDEVGGSPFSELGIAFGRLRGKRCGGRV